MVAKHVISKKRVMDHGEVYTHEREVKAMLDLVHTETDRIESRFLEPACGTGNFLIEVLRRKLHVVASRYQRSQNEYERYAFLAVSSIYGIDILQDNVEVCRSRLFEIVKEEYTSRYKTKTKKEFFSAVDYVLLKNILWGDALTLKTPAIDPGPIVFSEWSPVNSSLIKRRDFVFAELVSHASLSELPLFSDLGEDVFIPKPVKDYSPAHFLRLADVD